MTGQGGNQPHGNDLAIVWSQGRVFVTPASGCPARCSFCYLPSKDAARPHHGILSSHELVTRVRANKGFVAGPDGTVVAIGCYSEPLARHAIDSTLALLKELKILRNPVQLATRWALNRSQMQDFTSVARDAEVTLFHSFSTLTENGLLEAGTPSVPMRETFIRECVNAGIPSVLYIKPFIPGVTVQSSSEFVALAARTNLRDAVVGPLFLDARIELSLRPVLSPSQRRAAFELNDFPVGERSSIEPDPIAHSDVASLTAVLRAAGLRVVHHSWQVMALLR